MGTDKYEHSSSGVSSVLTDVDTIVDAYSDTLDLIGKKLNEIQNSGSWKDPQVKTAYIDTCTSYMNSFTAMLGVMKGYRDYVSKSSDLATSIETHYGG